MDARTTTKLIRSQRSGSETSSRLDTSRQATLTSGQLSMFDMGTLPDTASVISSPDLADGLAPSGSQDGQTISPCGPEAAHANRSRSPESEWATRIRAICGQRSAASSIGFVLQSSLESRLRARLLGSDLCDVTWKRWDTPWGQCLSRPRARVRTISETDTGLWATIRASDGAKGGPNMKFGAGGTPLPAMASQSIWQTPVADDALDRVAGKVNSRGEPKLSAQAIQASTWLTPSANEDAAGTVNGKMQHMLTQQAKASAIGTLGETESGGQLNPEFVSWLMGYPPEWLSCAPSETRSISGRQRNSSSRQSRPSMKSMLE